MEAIEIITKYIKDCIPCAEARKSNAMQRYKVNGIEISILACLSHANEIYSMLDNSYKGALVNYEGLDRMEGE